MPFRKQPNLLIDLEKKAERPIGSVGILALIELLVERIYALLKVLIAIVMIVGLVAGALQFQLTMRNRDIEKLKGQVVRSEKASRQAQAAAEAATLALNTAIANSQQASDDSTDAIRRINEIYDTCVVRKEC